MAIVKNNFQRVRGVVRPHEVGNARRQATLTPSTFYCDTAFEKKPILMIALNVMGNIPGMEHARAVKCDRCMSVMLAGIIVREFKECI